MPRQSVGVTDALGVDWCPKSDSGVKDGKHLTTVTDVQSDKSLRQDIGRGVQKESCVL